MQKDGTNAQNSPREENGRLHGGGIDVARKITPGIRITEYARRWHDVDWQSNDFEKLCFIIHNFIRRLTNTKTFTNY